MPKITSGYPFHRRYLHSEVEFYELHFSFTHESGQNLKVKIGSVVCPKQISTKTTKGLSIALPKFTYQLHNFRAELSSWRRPHWVNDN